MWMAEIGLRRLQQYLSSYRNRSNSKHGQVKFAEMHKKNFVIPKIDL